MKIDKVLCCLLISLIFSGLSLICIISEGIAHAESVNAANEDTKEYFVTIKIKQTSYSLDIWEHAKNAMNSFEIKVPTTKKFYDSVKVGQTLSDNWNKGSFVFRGGLKGSSATISEKTSK